MIFTKTVIWFQIFWSVAPTIWKLNAREEGITEIKDKENYLVIIKYLVISSCGFFGDIFLEQIYRTKDF